MPNMIENGVYRTNVQVRHAAGNRMRLFYISSLVIAMIVLVALMLHTLNQTIGLTAIDFEVREAELADGTPLVDLSNEDLVAILADRVSGQILNIIHANLTTLPAVRDLSGVPLNEALNPGSEIPDEWVELPINDLSTEERTQLLTLNLSQDRLIAIIEEEIIVTEVLEAWTFTQSVFERSVIERRVEENYPNAEIIWRSWLSGDFLTDQLNTTTAASTGIAPGLLGSIYIMILVGLISVPLGVGAAIYLEEYAEDTWYNNIIETNIRNLAGVPSIIYGLLGLAVFVRALDHFTSGRMVGVDGANGRTIISAALTLSLLILPIIIISAQEALRAVPFAIREGSYGMGATRWQTISRQILPASIPGIMTGVIIALSRAVGETAPLILVGAATFIGSNPNGPFSQYTALPILIYNWTSHPNPQFQNAAAAGIVLLLILMLTMNATAIYIRRRASRRKM